MSLLVKMPDGTFAQIAGAYQFDETPTQNSSNPVKSNGIYAALQGKQDRLTFDTVPTENSSNPVTSSGIYAAIQSGTGVAPTIDPTTKHWFIGDTDTGVVAEGQDGANGVTPHIDAVTKHWVIGETDTGVLAEGINGNDGVSATVDVGTVTTGNAGTNASVTNSGTTSAAVFNFVIPRGADGDSISVSVTTITGGHRITISNTNAEISDISFDVMNGIEIIQSSSDDRSATLLAEDWVGESAPYTQEISVLGITEDVVPLIGLVVSNDVETGTEEKKEWGYITNATSGINTITFSCYQDKPTIDLNISIKVV